MTLTEFLLARIAADEADARLCAETFPSPWEVADRGWRVRIYAANVPDVGDHAEPGDERAPCVMEVEPTHEYNDDRWLSERVQHVANFHPARVLAECEAKRRIVADHRHVFREGDGNLVADEWACQRCINEWYWCPTLRTLAAIYADHPDYDEAWRP